MEGIIHTGNQVRNMAGKKRTRYIKVSVMRFREFLPVSARKEI